MCTDVFPWSQSVHSKLFHSLIKHFSLEYYFFTCHLHASLLYHFIEENRTRDSSCESFVLNLSDADECAGCAAAYAK